MNNLDKRIAELPSSLNALISQIDAFNFQCMAKLNPGQTEPVLVTPDVSLTQLDEFQTSDKGVLDANNVGA
jgi:hypothetical protein